MRWLSWLALRELWARRGRSLLSLSALALAVGLVVATGSIGALMQATVAASTPLSGPAAEGPDRSEILWISSAYDVDYDLPAGLAAQVMAVPGVAGVQPLLRRPVRVYTPSTSPPPAPPRVDTLTLLGVDLRTYLQSRGQGLSAGTLPSMEEPGLVALAPWALVRDLTLGQPVTLTTPLGDIALPLVGVIETENLAAVQQGLVLYAPLEVVAGLFGLDGVATAFEVRLSSGASPHEVRANLEQRLGPAYAVSAASQLTSGTQLWQRLVLGALVFVDLLTLTGAVVLVFAVLAAAARSRRRQIGLLRAVGAVRCQVLSLLLVEATLLGFAGSALGLALGVLFAQLGTSLVLPRTAPPTFPLLPLGTLLLAPALGLLGSLAGAAAPAVQAVRRPPLAALYPLASLPQESSRGENTHMRASGRLSPPRSRGEHAHVRAFGPVSRLTSPLLPEMRLAIANLARERRRALLTVGALGLILAMALGNVGVLSLLGEELAAALGRLAGGDYLVLPGLTSISLRELAGQDTSDLPPLSPGLLAALDALRDRVWPMAGTTADVEALQVFPGQPTLLLDVEGYAQMGGFRFLEGDWPSALATFRQGPAVLLAPVVARRQGVGLGDSVRLDTPRGPVDFRVAGLGDSEFTTCVLDLDDGATYLGANEVNAVMIQLRPDADPDAVRQALLDAVQTHGGTLLPLTEAGAQLRAVFRQVQLSITLLIGIAGLVAGLGVVNAMLSSIAERRRELGLLRAVGSTRRQIARLILVEAAVLGAAAALVGTVLGWAVTLLFLGVVRTHLGLSGEGMASPAAWLPLLAASMVGLTLWPLLVMLGSLVPALHTARLPVIHSLYEISPG
jgi:putative ABC transport system permease protein